MSFEMLREEYTILHDPKVESFITERVKINKEGARIIWQAYIDMWGEQQKMEGRECRGGIAYSSEVEHYKEKGYLSDDFNWKDYKITKDGF